MAYRYAIYEKRGRTAFVTINRPEVLNALHAAASAELYGIFCDFRADPELWVAIITGAGERAFSTGIDLKVAASGEDQVATSEQRAPFGGITGQFECSKPIIAAVNGYALGGGFEIVLACDIVIAAEQATFGLPEPRWGRIAAAGGLHRLPRQIPLKIAMGLLLTGKTIAAPEALRLGLVNEVVSLAELLPAAERWAGQILECAPLSVRATKEAALRGLQYSVDQAMQLEYEEVSRYLRSEDRLEGPRAFVERRRPKWKGR